MRTQPLTMVFALTVGLGACSGTIGGNDPSTSGRSDNSGGMGGNSDTLSVNDVPDPGECADETPTVGTPTLRRLNESQYRNTVHDLFGFGLSEDFTFIDDHVGPFAMNGENSIEALAIDKYRLASEELATRAIADLDALLPCDASNGKACAETFIEQFGRRAWRRPLSETERADLLSAFEAGAPDGFARGIDLVLQVMLQSPNFVYFVEPADTDFFALDANARATRLSYLVWNSTPDDALLDAADRDELTTPAQLESQVQRMLEDDRALRTFRTFHHQWLGLPELEETPKNTDVYPEFTPALMAAMEHASDTFIDHVFTDGPGTYEELLLANYAFADGDLAALYDLGEPGDHGRITLPTESKRAGMLTQPAFLSAHAWADGPSPVKRGVWIRRNLFCDDLPAPPGDVEFGNKSGATRREQLANHNTNPSCKGCHDMTDPIGFALESFDGIGRFRATEGGMPVDDSGNLINTDVDGTLDGPIELAERLAASQKARQCYATQWFRYAIGRSPQKADRCSIARIANALQAGGGDIKSALVSLVKSDAFGHVNGGSQ